MDDIGRVCVACVLDSYDRSENAINRCYTSYYYCLCMMLELFLCGFVLLGGGGCVR